MANRNIPSLNARPSSDFLASDVFETSTAAATAGQSKKETRQQIGNWGVGQINPKNSVYAASTGPINATLSGNTFTANANGVLLLDGINPPVSSRVLIKDQVAQQDNGIFDVANLGSLSTPYVITRASDYDGSPAGPVQFGDTVSVAFGTTNRATSWQQIHPSPIVVNTTPIVFQKLSVSASGSVTSVGLTMPTGFNVTGSPVTGAGVLDVSTTWEINTPSRRWVNLGNVPLPVNYTNSTTNDLNFSIFMLLQNTPGNSTTINVLVGGVFVSQINSSAGAGGASSNLTMPLSGIIVPPSQTLSITLVGQAQVSTPVLAYISL